MTQSCVGKLHTAQQYVTANSQVDTLLHDVHCMCVQ